MVDRHLDLRVARHAKRGQVIRHVGLVYEKKPSARRDVVNVEFPTGVAAQPALAVADNSSALDLGPVPTEGEHAATKMVRVIRADHGRLCARIGAEATRPASLGGEAPEDGSAMLTGEIDGCYLAVMSATSGAMFDLFAPRVEHDFTRAARYVNCRPSFPVSVAFGAAKPHLRGVLYYIVRSGELLAAPGAIVSLRSNLRSELTRAPTVDRSRSVGLKFQPALEAHLEHR